MARRATKHHRTAFDVDVARIVVTSTWIAIVGLVHRHRRISAQECDEALAEERRVYLFGAAHPHVASAR
jgi:hypothetical protein